MNLQVGRRLLSFLQHVVKIVDSSLLSLVTSPESPILLSEDIVLLGAFLELDLHRLKHRLAALDLI